MKIRFYVCTGVQGSEIEDIVDVSETGYTAEEWRKLSDHKKAEAAADWAWNNGLEIGHQEIE